MKPTLTSLALIASFCLGASLSPGADDRPLRVITLNTVLTEIAREIGGDQVEVTGLVQPGVDPHMFQPSPADMRAVVEADVVFASGLSLETYLDRLLLRSGPSEKVIAVGDALPNVIEVAGGHHHHEKDPHWWHSIDNVIFVADLIRAEYAHRRPEAAEHFQRQAEAYRLRLRVLQDWANSTLSELPPARRQLITTHDAFSYFARDFGFTVHAIQGLSTEGDMNARHVAELIDLIRREDVTAVFAESSVSSRVIENLVRQTQVRLGGTLYADGLGPADSDAATYEAMYRHNVRTIVNALSSHGGGNDPAAATDPTTPSLSLRSFVTTTQKPKPPPSCHCPPLAVVPSAPSQP